MVIVNIDPNKLVPYVNNNKKHNTKQINNVMKSIQKYGFVQPVVIDDNNVIVIGHCRTEASKKLGLKEIPCVRVSDLTEEQVNALRVVDNKTNESEWDAENLVSELNVVDLGDFDFTFELPKTKQQKMMDILEAYEASVEEMKTPKKEKSEYSQDYCGIIIGGNKLELTESEKQRLIMTLGKFQGAYGTNDGFMGWLLDNIE